jgi:hypothetical protein
MIDRSPQRPMLLLSLSLALMVAAIGCGGGGPELTPEQATTLIMAQWPDSELEMRTTQVDEEGRGVAFARFDGEPWNFYFQPTEEGDWVLDAVRVEGNLYYLKDLEQISATMLLMGDVASALERYKVANGDYPAGESPEVLLVLIPDFIAEETGRHDAWEQDFNYESDGDDYTLISGGADKTVGTEDDIVLYNGDFVGSQGGEGQ